MSVQSSHAPEVPCGNSLCHKAHTFPAPCRWPHPTHDLPISAPPFFRTRYRSLGQGRLPPAKYGPAVHHRFPRRSCTRAAFRRSPPPIRVRGCWLHSRCTRPVPSPAPPPPMQLAISARFSVPAAFSYCPASASFVNHFYFFLCFFMFCKSLLQD